MPNDDPIPYQLAHFGARATADVTGANRNTVQGWVARYDLRSIGIQPGLSGVARLFSLEQLGALAVLRVAAAVQQFDGVIEALPEIAAHAVQVYQNIEARIWVESRDPTAIGTLVLPNQMSHLDGTLGLMGGISMFSVADQPYHSPESLRDLNGFPLPHLILPLDATLCMAWWRAARWARGFDRS